LLALLWAFNAQAAPYPPRFVPGQLLVKPRAGLSETNFSAKLHSHDAASQRTLHHSSVRVVAVPEEKAEATLAALRNDPDIEFAERDYVAEAAYVPGDPYILSGSEWHLAQIQTPQAWDFTVGLTNIIVAVLDSGVDAAHPDLATRILPGYDFVFNDPDPADDFGHGTAVCGTIVAAGDNDAGVAGVAFGCRVLPVKVMDAAGFAYYSTIAQGIHYAVDAGARIINLSIAGSSPSSTLQDAIDYAWDHNVVVVAAAGNNADNVPQYPAA
jgi:subtilisin family serine protease